MKKSKKVFIFFAFSFSTFLLMGEVFARAFTDNSQIPQWASNSINKVQEERIMTGFGDGSFRPHKKLNRAEAVTLLLRMKKIDSSDVSGGNDFSDVPASTWFAPAVAAATSRGWIKGFSNGTFQPAKTLNRAEWATLVSRVFDLDQSAPNVGFKDVPSKAWFARPSFALAKNNLIRENVNKFFPEREVTRADAAWIMAKILDMPRIIGTSQKNDFSRYSRTNSRRVAVKPRNFKAGKQGYDIVRKQLNFVAIPDGEQINIQKDSDWSDLGVLRVENNLDDPTSLHFLTFKFRFERVNVGPSQSFYVKIKGGGVELEKKVSRSSEVTYTGLDIHIPANDKSDFQVFIKPDENEFFYPHTGKGWVTVFDGGGSMISSFNKANSDRLKGYRFAPVGFENRKLRTIVFRAVK